jgi:hypothetical protein
MENEADAATTEEAVDVEPGDNSNCRLPAAARGESISERFAPLAEPPCLTASQAQCLSSISDELRAAIKASELSRYAISQATGIDQAVLSRFVAGKRGLSLESVDAIGKLLELTLARRQQTRAEGGFEADRESAE